MKTTEFYRRKRLLVTGSTGHLATNLVASLAETDCHIIRLSRPGASFAPVNGRAFIEEVTGNIADRAVWERVLDGVHVVFHFAACTSYAGNQNPLADVSVNLTPMIQLLETCRRTDRCPIVLFSGTVTQTGLTTRLPVDETHPDSPMTIYDLHKQAAEDYLKYYARQGVVRGASLRLANVYGPGPKTSNAERGLLNIMTRKALSYEPLTIYGDGNHLRDFVYATDVIEAFLLAGANVDRLNAKHFVIGSGRGETIAGAIHLVAERVSRKTGFRAPVINVDPPQPPLSIETRDFIADPRRFMQANGWRARISLEEGIDRTINYYMKECAFYSRADARQNGAPTRNDSIVGRHSKDLPEHQLVISNE
ncbi:MAG: NAD-dependent epimerase/dehydratase family protein [Acidobacteria bacterium]|nr:NAD-dependent epimerase/dehydratase family protein [Acidobacteriota bacterium]